MMERIKVFFRAGPFADKEAALPVHGEKLALRHGARWSIYRCEIWGKNSVCLADYERDVDTFGAGVVAVSLEE